MQTFQSKLNETPYHRHNKTDAPPVNRMDPKSNESTSSGASVCHIDIYPNVNDVVTLDLSLYVIFRIYLPAGNITLLPINGKTADVYMVELIQDSVGNRTISWWSNIKWAGGAVPTLTTAADKKDTFGFEYITDVEYNGYVIGKNI
jgi:hypothetical protein